MLIPKEIISVVTFPGAYVQRRIREVIIRNDKEASYGRLFLVSVAGLLANGSLSTLSAMAIWDLEKISLPAFMVALKNIVLLWLIFSFGMLV